MNAQPPSLRRPKMDRKPAWWGCRETSAPQIAQRGTDAVCVALEDVATQAPRSTPVPWSRLDPGLPTGLRGRADRAGDLPPRPEPREGRRQMQHDAAHRALDPHGELDQALPQGGDLRLRARGATRAALELLEQHVRGQ